MANKRHLAAPISRPQSASAYLHQVTPVTRYAPYASECRVMLQLDNAYYDSKFILLLLLQVDSIANLVKSFIHKIQPMHDATELIEHLLCIL